MKSKYINAVNKSAYAENINDAANPGIDGASKTLEGVKAPSGKAYQPLSNAEKRVEREASEMLLEFLQRRLDIMSLPEKQVMHAQTFQIVEDALLILGRKLGQMAELVFRNPIEKIQISFCYHSTDDGFSALDAGIEWGSANSDAQTITLMTVIAFAPKEIIREVATHEALHIIYRLLDSSCLTATSNFSNSVMEYPLDHQQEEQWVRNMVRKVGFKEENLAMWELAVEYGRENWRPIYYKLKKKAAETRRANLQKAA